jgi:hypothetical protein
MMKMKILAGTLAGALALAAPFPAHAKKKAAPLGNQPAAAQSPAAAMASPSPVAKATQRPIPFHGKIASVDASGKKFTLAVKTGTGRVLMVTGNTLLTKGGNPATFADVIKDEEVRGSYWKQPNGMLEAKTVKLGPPTVAEQAAKAKAKETKAAKAKAKATP